MIAQAHLAAHEKMNKNDFSSWNREVVKSSPMWDETGEREMLIRFVCASAYTSVRSQWKGIEMRFINSCKRARTHKHWPNQWKTRKWLSDALHALTVASKALFLFQSFLSRSPPLSLGSFIFVFSMRRRELETPTSSRCYQSRGRPVCHRRDDKYSIITRTHTFSHPFFSFLLKIKSIRKEREKMEDVKRNRSDSHQYLYWLHIFGCCIGQTNATP